MMKNVLHRLPTTRHLLLARDVGSVSSRRSPNHRTMSLVRSQYVASVKGDQEQTDCLVFGISRARRREPMLRAHAFTSLSISQHSENPEPLEVDVLLDLGENALLHGHQSQLREVSERALQLIASSWSERQSSGEKTQTYSRLTRVLEHLSNDSKGSEELTIAVFALWCTAFGGIDGHPNKVLSLAAASAVLEACLDYRAPWNTLSVIYKIVPDQEVLSTGVDVNAADARRFIWAVFRTILQHIELGETAEALQVLQFASNHSFISDSTLKHVSNIHRRPQSTLSSQRHFDQSVLLALGRTCLQMEWVENAAQILAFAVNQAGSQLSPEITELVEGCLSRPGGAHVAISAISTTRRPPNLVLHIRQAVLDDAFEKLLLYKSSDSLEKLTEWTIQASSKSKLDSGAAPPCISPKSIGIATLQRFLSIEAPQSSTNALCSHLYKQLSQQQSITSQYTQFINLFAKAGCISLAVNLWEHCQTADNAELVVSNVACASKLITSLWKDRRTSKQHLRDDESQHYLTQREENRRQARAIFDAMVSSKKPFASLSHSDLSAIARTAFLLGDDEIGLEAVQALIQRHEIPNINDLGLLLQALVRIQPASVLEHLQTLSQRNVKIPDEFWHSLLRSCLRHKQFELGSTIMNLEEANVALQSPAIASVLLKMGLHGLHGGADAGVEAALSSSFDAITALHIDSSAASKTFAALIDGVKSALRHRKPLIALQFWRSFKYRSFRAGDLTMVGRLGRQIASSLWFEYLRRQGTGEDCYSYGKGFGMCRELGSPELWGFGRTPRLARQQVSPNQPEYK